MNLPRLSVRMLAVIAISVVVVKAPCAEGNGDGLLLPFPVEASAEPEASALDARVPERAAETGKNADADALRALELAETFIRRQQLEIANSVPRRGSGPLIRSSDPAMPGGNGPIIAAASANPAAHDVAPEILHSGDPGSGGPSSALLPLPGNDSLGAPLDSLLPPPDAIDPGGTLPPDVPDSGPPGESDVPRTDLAPAPAYGGVENQDRRGPVFRVSGAQAFAVARARGFKFTPAGGMGVRDGNRTAAAQFPNCLTSEVHGIRMSQLRPPAAWSVAETSNTFFMFCDANYNAVRLAPGWRIRGIRLEGPNWRWVACPRSGSNTASFSIRIHAFKTQDSATAVQLAGLTLEGPEGATDWKGAFPWINGRGPLDQIAPAGRQRENPMPEAFLRSAKRDAEPPLPR